MLLVQNKTLEENKTKQNKKARTEIPECHLQMPRVYKTAPWFQRKRSVLPFYLAVCPPAAAVPTDPSPGPAPKGGCGHVLMAQKGLCRPGSQVCRCWQR